MKFQESLLQVQTKIQYSLLLLIISGSGQISHGVTADRMCIPTRNVELYINTTGNPGMSTGGAGDVLTGMIASFVGQGLTEIEAARAGAYIHGLAGDMAVKSQGETGLIATDLLSKLPRAIKELQQKKAQSSKGKNTYNS